MKKFLKLLSMGALCVTMLGISNASKAAVARTESTASARGFTTTGLTYLGDTQTLSYKIYTDNYTYGYCSMWSSVYKVVVEESNNTTCFIIGFIESSINSTGNSAKNRYFRNKQLVVETQFECSDSEAFCVNYFPESSSSSTSKSVGFSASGTYDSDGLSGTIGFSYTSTTQYSSVQLRVSDIIKNNVCKTTFTYDFLNYTNGEMVAPNINEVKERMYVVYQIPHYDGTETFNLTFKTHASIFKDATWPRPNGTRAGEIIDKFNGTTYYSHSNTNIDES